MSWLGTRSRHRKRSHAGSPAPTAGKVKFFEKTKVSPGSEFSLHFMKTALPSRLRAVPSELAASAEALLGSLFPTFRPPRVSPPAPRRGSRTGPREAAEQPPTQGATQQRHARRSPEDKSPKAEGYQSAG